jgi:hypothetical protein
MSLNPCEQINADKTSRQEIGASIINMAFANAPVALAA